MQEDLYASTSTAVTDWVVRAVRVRGCNITTPGEALPPGHHLEIVTPRN